MGQKSTQELENILSSTHADSIDRFLQENAGELLRDGKPFCAYMRQMIKAVGMTQQDVFLAADLPERYGYKLLSGEKRTKQRDHILRICYAAKMDLEQTQRALALYGMGKLYARDPRDAVLMVAFHQHRGGILAVNVLLTDHGMEPLRSCGNME